MRDKRFEHRYLTLKLTDVKKYLTRDQQDGCRHGRIPELLPSLCADLSKHTVFIAGSPAFVEACQTAARSQGAPAEQIKASLSLSIAGDPANAMYRLSRARFELRLPQADAAAILVDFSSALALDPQNIAVRLEFADVLEQSGDSKAASELTAV